MNTEQRGNGPRYGYTVALGRVPSRGAASYRDTALSFHGRENSFQNSRRENSEEEQVPEKIHEMRRMFEYGRESFEAKVKNFYRQGIFMQDYEDDAAWEGEFSRYFPTYHDLSAGQLRAYFCWRKDIREGRFRGIPESAAYIYIYELLNGIGTASPEESLNKLRDFEAGYIDAGFGSRRMRQNLRRWMTEFAVVKGLPPETVREYTDQDMLSGDAAICALEDPEGHTDEEVFSALCMYGGSRFEKSPVLAGDRERGMRLFSEVWRKAASDFSCDGKTLFRTCFGSKVRIPWYPLGNAVYYKEKAHEDFDLVFDDCRTYSCRNGVWHVDAYEKLYFDLSLLKSLMHEADARLRRYLKTGRYLSEKPEDAWAAQYVDRVAEEDRRAAIEAARPKISIDVTGLDKIREDALVTRDNLLTEEEHAQDDAALPEGSHEKEEPPEKKAFPEWPAEASAGPLLDAVQMSVVNALLREDEGRSADDILKENRMMPSIAADAINEALFDEIGDNVIECDDDRLSVVEDYREDIEEILGGM